MHKDTKKKQHRSKRKETKLPKHLKHINKMAAGIDIGAKSHFLAVPEGCDEVCLGEFKSFTTDLFELCM